MVFGRTLTSLSLLSFSLWEAGVAVGRSPDVYTAMVVLSPWIPQLDLEDQAHEMWVVLPGDPQHWTKSTDPLVFVVGLNHREKWDRTEKIPGTPRSLPSSRLGCGQGEAMAAAP